MLNLRLKPSMVLLGLLGAAHGGAFAMLWIPDLPGWFKTAGSASLMASLVFQAWRNAWLRAPRSVTGLVADREGLTVQTRHGESIPCRVLGTSYVSPWLTVLNLKAPGKWPSMNVVILPDQLSLDEFRRLRVLLRWGGLHRKPDKQEERP